MWKDICHMICMTISQMLTSADKGDSKLMPHWLVFYLRKLIQLSMFKKQQVTYENLGFCLLIKKSCLEARELHDDRQQHHRAMQPFSQIQLAASISQVSTLHTSPLLSQSALFHCPQGANRIWVHLCSYNYKITSRELASCSPNLFTAASSWMVLEGNMMEKS